MDITITIPKNQKDSWLADILHLSKSENEQYLFFKIPVRPTSTQLGDKCYVIINNQIIGYHLIEDIIKSNGFVCQTSGKQWPPGIYIVRKSTTWVLLEKPIPGTSHRGFRYFKGNK